MQEVEVEERAAVESVGQKGALLPTAFLSVVFSVAAPVGEP